MPKTNLSEKLFKPTFKQAETSTLIRRSTGNKVCLSNPCWYRNIESTTWIWRGVDPIELEEVLARIAASKAPRSDDNKLDTVIGYRSGNWIYEWVQQGMIWQQKAIELADEDPKAAAQYWLQAANFYSIAGYPHIRGDQLAEQADLLANNAYSEASALLPYPSKNIEFKVDNCSVTGFLHLPSAEGGPYPTVLLCGSMENLQSDYYKLFQNYLAPAGIAMLGVDLPSVGHCSRWTLTHNTSELHQKVLQQMGSVPWIDGNKIVAMGINFGGNVAVRLAYMEPKRLRGVISWSGVVHYALTSGSDSLPISDMHKDVLASRLGLCETSDALLKAELSSYSLKVQGLLGHRCSTPMLAIAVEGDEFSPLSESKLIVSSSADGELLQMKSSPLRENTQKTISHLVEWIKRKVD